MSKNKLCFKNWNHLGENSEFTPIVNISQGYLFITINIYLLITLLKIKKK